MRRIPVLVATHDERPVPTARNQAPLDEHERLTAIYREHFAFVWRSLRRLGVPEDALEDLAQDVFVVAWRRVGEFEGRSSMRTWLFGISLRVYRTRRRGEWRRRRKLDELATTNDLAALADDPTRQRDAQQLLLALLDGLDDDKRAVYVLAELEGFTAAEIAEGLDVNPNTVSSRLRAARKELHDAAAKLLADGGKPS